MTNQEKYNKLMNEKELFTTEDYKFCLAFNEKETKQWLSYHLDGTYLNCGIYSEHEHDAFQLKMEQGI